MSGSAGSGSALSIFAEPQRYEDHPSIDAGPRLLPQTFHRLQSVPWRGYEIFAAQSSSGGVCLVELSVDARVAAACSTIDGFRRRPLRLTFQADVYQDASTKTGQVVNIAATWTYLGEFSTDETSAKE